MSHWPSASVIVHAAAPAATSSSSAAWGVTRISSGRRTAPAAEAISGAPVKPGGGPVAAGVIDRDPERADQRLRWRRNRDGLLEWQRRRVQQLDRPAGARMNLVLELGVDQVAGLEAVDAAVTADLDRRTLDAHELADQRAKARQRPAELAGKDARELLHL